MSETREVMNVRQAAAYLGISTDTLYKYVADGKVPGFRLGNRWRFKKTLLDDWMEDSCFYTTGIGGSPRMLSHTSGNA